MAGRTPRLLWNTKGGKSMAHAIIRGADGRRHEVDFEGVEITVEVFLCDEIASEARRTGHLRTSGASLC